MENAAWYTWDDMTPWRFAILGGVILVTLVVIKLAERYGSAAPEDGEFLDEVVGYNPHIPGNYYHDNWHRND